MALTTTTTTNYKLKNIVHLAKYGEDPRGKGNTITLNAGDTCTLKHDAAADEYRFENAAGNFGTCWAKMAEWLEYFAAGSTWGYLSAKHAATVLVRTTTTCYGVGFTVTVGDQVFEIEGVHALTEGLWYAADKQMQAVAETLPDDTVWASGYAIGHTLTLEVTEATLRELIANKSK